MKTANGESFRLAVADCPATSCQSTDNIARFGLDAADQAQLDAYTAALKKEQTKDGVKAAIAVGVAVTAPATVAGALVGGAVVGGASSASDQCIDSQIVDGNLVLKGAVIGGAVGGATSVIVSAGGVVIPKIGQALDDVFSAKALFQSEFDAYLSTNAAQKISQNASRDVSIGNITKLANSPSNAIPANIDFSTAGKPQSVGVHDTVALLGREWSVVSPRGLGSATGPVPQGYVPVSRWVKADEVPLWIENGGTAVPADIGAGGRVYVTVPGAVKPGGTAPVRIDFSIPKSALSPAGKVSETGAPEWFQIFQPVQRAPIYNVQIHIPAEVNIPRGKQ